MSTYDHDHDYRGYGEGDDGMLKDVGDEWQGEDEIEVWGHCGMCGAPLHFEDGDVCPVCANPIDDDEDAPA